MICFACSRITCNSKNTPPLSELERHRENAVEDEVREKRGCGKRCLLHFLLKSDQRLRPLESVLNPEDGLEFCRLGAVPRCSEVILTTFFVDRMRVFLGSISREYGRTRMLHRRLDAQAEVSSGRESQYTRPRQNEQGFAHHAGRAAPVFLLFAEKSC